MALFKSFLESLHPEQPILVYPDSVGLATADAFDEATEGPDELDDQLWSEVRSVDWSDEAQVGRLIDKWVLPHFSKFPADRLRVMVQSLCYVLQMHRRHAPRNKPGEFWIDALFEYCNKDYTDYMPREPEVYCSVLLKKLAPDMDCYSIPFEWFKLGDAVIADRVAGPFSPTK